MVSRGDIPVERYLIMINLLRAMKSKKKWSVVEKQIIRRSIVVHGKQSTHKIR